jgi:hypothetical protein
VWWNGLWRKQDLQSIGSGAPWRAWSLVYEDGVRAHVDYPRAVSDDKLKFHESKASLRTVRE